ncbi:MAG: FHA domain-containing protein [Bdellovibrionales bacterium]|nr:FHA domain-containing protein [Bdellovibrionales bacterium]
MFALEIDFHDGISPPETILVRRPNAVIGSSDLAHVVIEGAGSSLCELRLVRGLGREFGCFPVRKPGNMSAPPPFLEGSYQGDAALKLGDLSVHVTSLDLDLVAVPDESYDRAAMRALRTALTSNSTTFPAAAVLGARILFVSFPPSSPLLVGRSRMCGLRLDATDVSAEHARLGVEGGKAWVEDLGSTNGTFVGEERIAGRRYLEPGERVSIGREYVIAVVLDAEQVSGLNVQTTEFPDPSLVKSFPCIVSRSSSVRPGRFPLRAGATVKIGRDPANDIWISAAHISRSHVHVRWDGEGEIEIIDSSSNGTYFLGNRLERDVPVRVPPGPALLDLCSGVVLAICRDELEEKQFFEEQRDEKVTAAAREVDVDSLAEAPLTEVNFQQDEDHRRVSGHLAGGEDAFSDFGAEASSGGVFTKLAQRQANRAQADALEASHYGEPEPGVGVEGDGPANFSMIDEELDVGDGFAPYGSELSEFERYQQEQRLEHTGMLELQPDYNLLSEGEFDDELLTASSFGGGSKAMLAVGVVTLVILVAFVCMVLFSNSNPIF